MNDLLRNALERGRLVLLLGAGASVTSRDMSGRSLLMGEQLAELLASEAGMPYQKEPLNVVCAAARKRLGERFFEILEERYKHCTPSDAYRLIAKHSWARIYTLNIDDALDGALCTKSPQHVDIRYRDSKIFDQDQMYRHLDYIKLNGSIDRPEAGFIFSTREYGVGSAVEPLWYRELAEDFFRYTFLFIGTKINESLFYHQIERYRSASGAQEQRSFVLTPSATQIEKESWLDNNLEHISGTLDDFAQWLNKSYPNPIEPTQLAMARHPQLAVMLSFKNAQDKEKYAELYTPVTVIDRATLAKSAEELPSPLKIRDFYRGFKPSWRDILDGVPAEIKPTRDFFKVCRDALQSDRNLVVLYGPAGSGKSTLLKQIAVKLRDDEGTPVYYIDGILPKLNELLEALEKSNTGRYYVIYDKLDTIASDLEAFLQSGRFNKGLIIGAERQHIWESRTKFHLQKFCPKPIFMSLIDERDAKEILDKLEKYGPWTRLAKMNQARRIDELTRKAKRQLLIGLLETTSGDGFEKIIEDDYQGLGSHSHKSFLLLVGFGTVHRLNIQDAYVGRALRSLGINKTISSFASDMAGIVQYQDGYLTARHPVYMRHLIEKVIEPAAIFEALHALLTSYTVYEAPVLRAISKNEGAIFKANINHNFLKTIFRSDNRLILRVYESFEKAFESDGLFWLQYGLALRASSDQWGALEKLRTAVDAYPMLHTEHAYAQQELIVAAMCNIPAKAYEYLSDAKTRLERLDEAFGDPYTIVALSEGHTNVVRQLEGDVRGREVAKHYASILQYRKKAHPSEERLHEAWTKLAAYAVGGTWSEQSHADYIW